MAKRRWVWFAAFGLLLIGTAFGVVSGITDGEWTTAANGFALCAGGNVMWTHVHVEASPRRRAVALVLVALSAAGLVAAFMDASGTTRLGLGLTFVAVIMFATFAVGARRFPNRPR